MRAQFWSFDAIFAIVIFGVTITIMAFVWTGINSQFALTYGFGMTNMQAQLQGLQARIVSQGAPEEWNFIVDPTNTLTWTNMSVGLGTGNGTALSLNKMMTLMAMANHNSTAYQTTKPLLGVGYDYYITIYYQGNLTVPIGLSPSGLSPTAIQVATQSATIGGVPVRMQILVWTNKSFGVS
jgi:hypothetical protein